MRIEDLQQHHLDELRVTVQPMQVEFGDMLARSPGFLDEMKQCGPTRAFLDGARVLGCAGLIEFPRTGRSVLWCGYCEDLARQFVWMFKAGVEQLLAQNWRRCEAWIDPSFEASKRLARLGGFSYEGTMRSFWSDGTDRELWARVR